jgi:hypothetical protein
MFRRDWFRRSVDWLDAHNGAMTAVATVVIAVLTWFLVTTSNRQWQTMQTANGLASKNTQIQLRAYVDPGARDGKPAINLVTDKLGNITNIEVHFINAGLTSARHFGAVSYSEYDENRLRFRTRYESTYVGAGPMKGRKGLDINSLTSTDATIPAGGSEVRTFPSEAADAASFIANHRPNRVEAVFVVGGYFEYCDVFGHYWCDSFSHQLVPDPEPHFISSDLMRRPCDVQPEIVPPPWFPEDDKNEKLVAVPRCEQPAELEVDQGGQAEK